MSFQKGKFYRCIKNQGMWSIQPITVGKAYEALAVAADFLEVRTDRGGLDVYGKDEFDTNPVLTNQNIAPSVVAAHAATMQAQSIASLAPRQSAAKVMASGAICACGKQAEKKMFATFEYFFCPACKVEVGGKAEKSNAILSVNHVTAALDSMGTSLKNSIAQSLYGVPVSNQSQQQVLPPGVYALKGEKVTCSVCSVHRATLLHDLTDQTRGSILDWDGRTCPHRDDSYFRVGVKAAEYHVRGRGWV